MGVEREADAEGAPQGAPPDFVPAALGAAVASLAPVLYQELKRVARRERRRAFSPHTLTTTSLVHDCYLRLAGQPAFESHEHYLRVAAVTMRHLLIDRARRQLAAKRGGGEAALPLDEADAPVIEDETTVLAVHEALSRLARFAPRQANVVECRYFGGYSHAQIAQALGLTERTVERDWQAAKAWLARELGEGRGPG